MTPFAAIFVPDHYREAVSDEAWVEAMLEFERGLVAALVRAGIAPETAVAEVDDLVSSGLVAPEDLADEGRAVGNPAEPLVRALQRAASEETARWIHRGATSQDVLDTAAMLVAARVVDMILVDAAFVCASLASLAREHRSTPMPGRTLLQHAVPTTFGARAAAWLTATREATARLADVRRTRLAAELGGAAGTLAPLGDAGPTVAELLATELDLAAPVGPWHTDRTRVGELAAALALVAQAMEKIGLDIVLLAQTDVAELVVAEGGGSSAMPQKRNPVGAVVARASAIVARGNAAMLVAGSPHELERAAGAWQAEWAPLSSALAHTGGAVAAIARALGEIEADAVRMERNLHATDGGIVAERIATRLARHRSRREAHDAVADAFRAATSRAVPIRHVLLERSELGLSPEDLDNLLDPTGYLGSAEAFVDAALAAYEREER